MVDIKLRVFEANEDQVASGICVIDSPIMKELDVKVGDTVEIEGDRKTVAIVDRSSSNDIGFNGIKIDTIIRRNAQTGIEALVKVRKAHLKEAQKIIVIPKDNAITIRGSPKSIRDLFIGRVCVKGDVLFLIHNLSYTPKAQMDHPFFRFKITLPDIDSLSLTVIDTIPKGNVIISNQTEFIVKKFKEYIQEEENLKDMLILTKSELEVISNRLKVIEECFKKKK